MKPGLSWTKEAIDHMSKHGIRWEHVECVVRGPFYERRAGGRRTIIGRCAGRTLFVVLEPSSFETGTWVLVTARPAEPPEKRLLARRGKGIR